MRIEKAAKRSREMNERVTCPDCEVGVGQPHQDECDVERPYRLCNVGCDGMRLNEEHPLIRRLTSDQRAELVAKLAQSVKEMSYIELEWIDPSEPEARRWRSPLEMCVNSSSWVYVEVHPEWMGANLEAVLTSAGLRSTALACLDDDDQFSLASSLADAAVAAFENGWDVTERLWETLTEWLQDWTETDEEELQTLVRIVRSMLSPRPEEQAVNWRGQGF